MVSNHVCNDKTMRGWSRKLKNMQGGLKTWKILIFEQIPHFPWILEDLEGFGGIPMDFEAFSLWNESQIIPKRPASARKHSQTHKNILSHPRALCASICNRLRTWKHHFWGSTTRFGKFREANPRGIPINSVDYCRCCFVQIRFCNFCNTTFFED